MAKPDCRKLSRKLGKWGNVTKIIMGICFLIVFILGVALFGTGIAALTGSSLLSDFPIASFTALMYTAVFLGLFLAIVSILGAIGYFALHKTLLIIVVCLIAVLAVVQAICGGVSLSYKNKDDDLTQLFHEGWDLADNSTREYFEKQYTCCGGLNKTDHPEAPECVGTASSGSVPPPPPPPPASSSAASSVASSASSASSANALTVNVLTASQPEWKDGCIPSLVEVAKENVVKVGAGLIAVTVLEVAVIIVTIILLVKIGRASSYYEVHDDDAMDVLQS